MRLFKVMIVTGLLACAAPATAALIDFKAAADGAVGESAWDPLNTASDLGFGIDIDIVGLDANSTDPDYAYLDANVAGLGVCGDLVSGATANTATGSGSNLCDPSSDDNVTIGESLKFTFNEAVSINSMWFNNNHDDPDWSLTGDTITINGVDVTFGAGDIDPARSSGSDGNGDTDFLYSSLLAFNAGDMMTIAYNNEQFYLSAMEVRSVPLPSTIALLAMGLLGIGLARRRIRD